MNAHEDFKQLVHAIKHAKSVVRSEHGYTFTGGSGSKAFTRIRVMALDKRLPSILDYALDNHPTNVASIVRQTIQHWQRPGTPLEHWDDSRLGPINHVTMWENSFIVHAARYKVKQLTPDIEVTSVPVKTTSYVVDEKWMEKYYPGVATKVKILLSIGTPEKEASKMALEASNMPTLPVEIDSITFN